MEKQQVSILGGPTRHGWMLWFPSDTYVGKSLSHYGEYSTSEWWIYQQFVDKSCDVVEVGAHLGAHTLPFARAAKSVTAYEPQGWLYRLLAANMAINRCENAIVRNAACGEENGKIWLPNLNFNVENNYGAIELSDWKNKLGENRCFEVPLVRLDDVTPGGCHFIKIDAEGYEASVLRGAIKLIRSSRPVMYIENDRPAKSRELIELIHSLGYRTWWHIAPLHCPEGFYDGSGEVDVFPNQCSFSVICMPNERVDYIDGVECAVEDCEPPMGKPLSEKHFTPKRVVDEV